MDEQKTADDSKVGEWTALREALLAKAKEWRRRERHAGSPGEAYVYPFLADELEALAAAAPAPPRKLTVGNITGVLHNNGVGLTPVVAQRVANDLNGIVAPPPQDGQGAELLGPPRGGSSSDLAEQAISVASRLQALEQARQICLAEKAAWHAKDRWLAADAADNCEIGIRALMSETEAMPSKAEREVASATSSLNVGDEVWVRAKVMQFIEPEHNGVEILLEIGRNELMRTWCNASDLRRME